MTGDEELDNWNDALIEEYVLFLRGRGPGPDLSDLPPRRRQEIRGQFEVVRALADHGPELPPLDQDPVARRLGLVAPEASSRAVLLPGAGHLGAGAGDLLERSLDEVAFRFKGRVVFERDPAWSRDAPRGLRAVAQCAVLGEAVAVFAGDTDARTDLPERLTWFFGLHPEVSAVCVSSPDAQQAVVFPPAGATASLNPALGWVDAHRPRSPEPLSLALGRFLEQRLPRWDQVAAADVFTAMDGTDAAAADALDAQIDAALRARPRLPFKKDGQRVLADMNRRHVASLLVAVQAGDLAPSELVEKLTAMAGAEAS